MLAEPHARLSGRAVRLRTVLGCALLLGGGALALPRNDRLRQAPPAGPRRAPAAMRFEANRGQWPASVRFVARGRGQGLTLTDQGATLALLRSDPSAGGGRRLPNLHSATLIMRVAGARPVAPVGAEPLPGNLSHYLGRDPARWSTGGESYGLVRYPRVLPGVDLVFRGAGEGQLEYDLLLDPGVDPAAVALAFEGARSLQVDAMGGALLDLPGGQQLRQPPPVVYQEDQAGARTLVVAHYLVRPDRTLGFAVGAHDRSRPLVINPTLVYSTYLGGASADAAYGVASDAAGNIYLTGYTVSTDFPTAGPQAAHGGGVDLFVTKLNAAGGGPVYSTYLGGSNGEVGLGIAVDAAGSVYVTGETLSADFPVLSAFQGTRASASDAFVAKLGPTGALVYSTYLGGGADDVGQAIAVDAVGRAHVTGQTFSPDFPLSAPLQGTFGGERDAFVTKLASAGNALLYSTFLGGSYDDFGQGIGLDAAGNAYVGGYTFSTDFPTVAALQPTGAAGFYADAFVSKLNGAGLALVYSTYLGGSGDEQAYGLSVDAAGSATIAGYTSSTNFPVVAAWQPTFRGGNTDGFVSKLAPSGAALVYSTHLGGSGDDLIYAIATSAFGRVHVTGYTTSSDFPLTNTAPQGAPGGGYDGFATAIGASGSGLFSTYLGGNGTDYGLAAATSGAGFFVAGQTNSTNFPTAAALQPGPRGLDDAFVTRYTLESPVPASGTTGTIVLGAALALAGVMLLARRRHAP